MAGWPSYVFGCLSSETEAMFINTHKERGTYAAILTDKGSPIKDLLYGIIIRRTLFSCWTRRVIPKGAK